MFGILNFKGIALDNKQLKNYTEDEINQILAY